MDFEHLAHALDLIFATTEDEPACDELQAYLAEYVEFEMAGGDPAVHFPAAAAHLLQCADCAEDYEGLLEVSRLEVQAVLPRTERILRQFPAAEPEPVPLDTELVLEVQPELVPVAGR